MRTLLFSLLLASCVCVQAAEAPLPKVAKPTLGDIVSSDLSFDPKSKLEVTKYAKVRWLLGELYIEGTQRAGFFNDNGTTILRWSVHAPSDPSGFSLKLFLIPEPRPARVLFQFDVRIVEWKPKKAAYPSYMSLYPGLGASMVVTLNPSPGSNRARVSLGEWATVSRQFAVPATAKFFGLRVDFTNATGAVDFRNVKISNLPPQPTPSP